MSETFRFGRIGFSVPLRRVTVNDVLAPAALFAEKPVSDPEAPFRVLLIGAVARHQARMDVDAMCVLMK